MEKNGFLNITLSELLNALDARAIVSIFENAGAGSSDIKNFKRVYELLSDKDFIKRYGNRDVIGLLGMINVTNILVEEA